MEAAVSPANEEAREAWDGVLFDRFLQYRDIVTTGLGAHGARAMGLYPPKPGDRVLDIGCGFGDTTQVLAGLVGPEGQAVGIDVAERFIELARDEAQAAGVTNVSFRAGDLETADLGGPYDYAFSRMGIMFFANPVAALRNVRQALVPGGRIAAAVWRRKLDNDWMHRAELIVEKYLDEPEDSDEPTCGPGPFSMADADTTSQIFLGAGFEDVSLHRNDIDIKIGNDPDEAVEFAMALGPAGEVIRLAGAEAEEIRPKLAAEIREALADFVTADGVAAPASTWTIGARAPTSADR